MALKKHAFILKCLKGNFLCRTRREIIDAVYYSLSPIFQRAYFTDTQLKLAMLSERDELLLDRRKQDMLEMVQSFVYPLNSTNHKGQCGRIGIIGGSIEYTGAPYFAAISALKLGADLAHVFCSSVAAPVIKSYSPELVVHPLLDVPNAVDEILNWLPRLHSIVIGPGLGRDPKIFSVVEDIIYEVRKLGKPIIIDADGLALIQSNIEIISKVPEIILTPNIMEFQRLFHKVFQKNVNNLNLTEDIKSLSIALGNITILCKGEIDIISDGDKVVKCSKKGSNRRCGGQGDLLSGTLGVFTYWAKSSLKTGNKNILLNEYGSSIGAAFASSYLTRACNHLAFAEYNRSMLTSNMIDKIGNVLQSIENEKL